MKILFLTNEAPDFLQDLVLHGLVTLLGTENVLPYPRLDRHYADPPPDYRYLAMQYLGLPPPRGEEAALEVLAAEADAVVAGGIRGTARLNLLRVLELRLGKPIAALDGWDDPYVRKAIRHVDLYFKRETLITASRLELRLPARKAYHALRRRPDWRDRLRRQVAVATARVEKLVPLPFAVIDTGLEPQSERTYDVAFVGAPTSPLRVRLVEELRQLRADGYRVYLPDDPEWRDQLWHEPTRLAWPDYMRLLASSRICISLRGVGYDTYRYWEIPYAGSLLLAEYPQTVIPDNFVEGEEAVFAEPARLGEAARRLLERDTERIAAAGRAKLLRRHTSVQRAQVVAERLEALSSRA